MLMILNAKFMVSWLRPDISAPRGIASGQPTTGVFLPIGRKIYSHASWARFDAQSPSKFSKSSTLMKIPPQNLRAGGKYFPKIQGPPEAGNIAFSRPSPHAPKPANQTTY